MKQKLSLVILTIVFALISQIPGFSISVDKVYSSNEYLPRTKTMQGLLSERSMSLETRYANKFVNDVFKDNILLTLAYLSGSVANRKDINWDSVRMSSRYQFYLDPGEVFAFHDDVLSEYRGRVTRTTNAHFNFQDGFRSSGYLYGDGVCHLASLINWAARDAGLKVDSRVNHNFANIPEIPKEYGTSIVTTGASSLNAQMQNLYIENTFDKPVRFVFHYEQNILSISIYI